MTKQATKASEQSKQQPDTKRQQTNLDKRYGKIGISAVAAACAHKGHRATASGYRIPYDRD